MSFTPVLRQKQSFGPPGTDKIENDYQYWLNLQNIALHFEWNQRQFLVASNVKIKNLLKSRLS